VRELYMAARYSKAFRSKDGIVSKAKVYETVCSELRPSAYSDYEALNVQVKKHALNYSYVFCDGESIMCSAVGRSR
jgi:hypothetical protein